MPYQPHNRVILRGGMPNSERWSTSVAICDVGTGGEVLDGFSEINAFVNNDTAGGTWQAAIDSLLQQATTGVTVDQIVAQSIQADGGVRQQAIRTVAFTGNGTPSASNLPNQCAVVASLQTIVPGSRGRGRMYLPLIGVTRTTGTQQMDSTARTTCLAGVDVFFDKVRAAADAAGTPLVSQICIASNAAGVNIPVVRIRVGSVIDTMRGRRDSITETYTVANYP